jgi:hypothetical protein
MRHVLIGGTVLLSLAGCAQRTSLEEKPLAAEAMPVSFAYGSLARGQAEYAQAMEPRSGESIKRMKVFGEDEWAIVDVRAIGGDFVFTTKSPKLLAQSILKRDLAVRWGESGTVRDGSRPIGWQRFDVTDEPPASCLALTKGLREHPQAGPARNTQELVAGVYCRRGANSLPAGEIPEIAAALRTKR